MNNLQSDKQICRRVAIAMRGRERSHDVDVCGAFKGQHSYFFLYLPTQRTEAMQAAAAMVKNKQLGFSDLEAAEVTCEILRQEKAAPRAGGRLRGRA